MLTPENAVFKTDLGNCSNTENTRKALTINLMLFGHGQSRRGRDRALGNLLIGIRKRKENAWLHF